MKMICPNCGKEYNEKMTCCISCGADLVPAENKTEMPTSADLPLENEPLIQPIVSEYVPVSSGSAVSFDSGELFVPMKRVSRSTSLSDTVKFTGSLIAAVVMLALILTSAASAGLRLLTDENKIASFADSLDIMALPAESFGNEGATVQDAVYTMSLGTGLSRDDIRNIYEESTAKEFLAAQLTGYAEYIRSGTAPERLTAEQLKAVFEENIPLIDDAMGQPLNDHDVNLALSEIDRAKPLLDLLSHENIEQTIGGNTLIAIRIFSSLPAIIVTAALAASMLIAFRAINKKSTSALSWGGGTTLIGGAAVLAATFLFSAQLPYNNADRLVRSVLKCACDVISPDLYRIGAILAVVGIVMLIWAESLKKSGEAR